MQKFLACSTEYESHVAKRHGAHRKARHDSRNQPVVMKVAPAPVAVAPAEAQAPATEETKTEE